MPYIGRNHIAGDHTSNFKVLDDISSYTATFNGSSATVISTADETIRIPDHRFLQGQRVTYTNGGGGNIGGLITGTAYFVTFDNHNRIKLATSLSNANNNTNINLSSVGTGSAHTLTAAFDGVNKTFKATHSGGLDVNINNSTQLNIAINNVIQKPNNDASYTEGFRVVDHEKIQFQVAPTADDVFWGTVIANTIETFDISDLKIDNFTGDGSTTDFVLSREVPNNESLMVTLDGVLQHPSDQNVSRAYIVVVPNNIIQFTAAPGNGVEVQVRHLGFAGAATGEVSGFYGRTGNVVLGSGDNIIVGGINATGIITTPQFNVGSNIKLGNAGVITATSFVGSGAALTGIDATSIKDSSGNIKIQAQASGAVYTGIHTFTTLKSTSADFSGSVSIGGTLTYEDVTNIDSVGVITARDNIKVGTGVTIESNGQATFVGVVTFGSGSTTIDNNVVNVGTALTLGHTQGLQFHTQNLHSAGFEVNQINSSGIITATTLKSSNLTANRVVFTTTGGQLEASGNLTYNGTTLASGSPFDINADLDVDGHTNLDNVSIAGVTTSSNKFQVNGLGIGIQPIDHHHIHIESANPRILIRSTGTNAAKILFGDNSSNDPGVIEYAHSSNSMMFNTGNLERLRITSTGRIEIGTGAGVNASAPMEFKVSSSSTWGDYPEHITLTDQKAFGSADNGAGIQFGGKYNTAGNATTFGSIHGKKATTADGNYGGILTFNTREHGNSNFERLRIDSLGRVFINAVNGVVPSADYRSLNLVAHAHTEAGISFGRSSSVMGGGSNGGNSIVHGSDGALYFATHNVAERMRIDQSGRVVIGGTSAYIGGAALAVMGTGTSPNTYGSFAIGKIGANPSAGTTLANIRLNGGSVGTRRGAEINAIANGAWTDGSSHPTKLSFAVANTNSASATERYQINHYGHHIFTNENTLPSSGAPGTNSFKGLSQHGYQHWGQRQYYSGQRNMAQNDTFDLFSNNTAHDDIIFWLNIKGFHANRTFATAHGTIGGYGLSVAFQSATGVYGSFSAANIASGRNMLRWTSTSPHGANWWIWGWISGTSGTGTHTGWTAAQNF